jgi:hypothetical protein
MPAAGELWEGRVLGRRVWAWQAGARPTTSWRHGGEAGDLRGRRKETTWPPTNSLLPCGGRAPGGALVMIGTGRTGTVELGAEGGKAGELQRRTMAIGEL